ncbi:hypothetical protein I7I53_08737 [Histoplasma capsulatum var. duboisii H88]|uniref:Uncharacterized protein n=1 Tax=Ajellomyces capsulatus (strain H88) TaxID=544711 RepID=A0A8A1L5L6_AJEC8|nr:hypothetical protein I7I53_08737 [Histoplasma capsulatum var. duboisii H88]
MLTLTLHSPTPQQHPRQRRVGLHPEPPARQPATHVAPVNVERALLFRWLMNGRTSDHDAGGTRSSRSSRLEQRLISIQCQRNNAIYARWRYQSSYGLHSHTHRGNARKGGIKMARAYR